MTVKRLAQLLSPPYFPARQIELDNGLTLIHQQMSATPTVVADVWVAAGALQEPDEAPGLAHFLEHMVFKGTDRIAPGIFDLAIENRGGVSNAATSYDYTHFYINTAVPHIGETLPYLADILLHPAIPQDEFEQEREVVLSEIRHTEDDPDWLGLSTLLQELYPHHAYGRSVLGTQTQVLSHTPEQMHQFHRDCYRPEKITVAMVGDISERDAIELVNESFGDLEPSSSAKLAPSPSQHREQCSPLAFAPTKVVRKSFKYPRLEQARLMMGWLGPGVDRLHDAYSLDLISVLLACGRTSRLVKELEEEKELVYAIGSDFSLQKESSLFTITAWLAPQYLETVEEIVRDRMVTLHDVPLSNEELRSCQRQLCNDYAFSTEIPSQLAGLYGYYNTVADAKQAVDYPHRIQTLTAGDIQQVARKYLNPQGYVSIHLQPLW